MLPRLSVVSRSCCARTLRFRRTVPCGLNDDVDDRAIKLFPMGKRICCALTALYISCTERTLSDSTYSACDPLPTFSVFSISASQLRSKTIPLPLEGVRPDEDPVAGGGRGLAS